MHNKMMPKKSMSLTGIICLCCLLASCRQPATDNIDETGTDEPTTTYSIVRPDEGGGIEIISEDGNNPLKTREYIMSYPIPEKDFPAKRAKFYQLLNQLKSLAETDSVSYDDVDSLNYMAIHYLLDLLQDKKSLAPGLRHPMLRFHMSADKRLRHYAWNENIAPGQQSQINVFQYSGTGGKPQAAFLGAGKTLDETDYHTGKIESLNTLYRPGDSTRLYLLSYSGSHGNEHLYKGFGCIRIVSDSIDFGYPAFKQEERPFVTMHYTETENAQACYDSRNRTLKLQRTPSSSEKGENVGQAYTFDGRCFTHMEN